MSLQVPQVRSEAFGADTSLATSNWAHVQLKEVAEMRLGKMLDAQKNRGTPRLYLRNPNIRWFDVDLSTLREMLFESAEEDKYSVHNGDVLICEGGEAGRAAIWAGPDAGIKFQKAVHRVRTGPRLLNRFLVHRLFYDFHRGALNDYYTGSTIAHLTGQDLARYELELPPIDEQRRIVAILDQTDDLRRKRRAALEWLDRLATVTFSNLFGDPLRNSRDWSSGSTLGELAEIVSGVTKGRRLTGTTVREVPYLAVSNVQDRALRLTAVKSIEATEDEIARFRLLPGDLLLTEGGDPDKLGRGTLWQGELLECIHQNHIFRVRLCSDLVQPLFLNWLVASERGKRYFLQSAKQTTGIASINIGQLRSFPMLLPPVDLQRAFAARIAEIDRLKASHCAHLADLDALFASLQHRAFRGEL